LYSNLIVKYKTKPDDEGLGLLLDTALKDVTGNEVSSLLDLAPVNVMDNNSSLVDTALMEATDNEEVGPVFDIVLVGAIEVNVLLDTVLVKLMDAERISSLLDTTLIEVTDGVEVTPLILLEVTDGTTVLEDLVVIFATDL